MRAFGACGLVGIVGGYAWGLPGNPVLAAAWVYWFMGIIMGSVAAFWWFDIPPATRAKMSANGVPWAVFVGLTILLWPLLFRTERGGLSAAFGEAITSREQ